MVIMTKFCPRCGTKAIDDESLFCSRCGSKVPHPEPEKRIENCPACGTKILGKESCFCHTCGSSLLQPQPAYRPPAPKNGNVSRAREEPVIEGKYHDYAYGAPLDEGPSAGEIFSQHGKNSEKNHGSATTEHEPTEIKSTGLTVILSLIITGLGQIYCGQTRRGLIFLFAFIVSCILSYGIMVLSLIALGPVFLVILTGWMLPLIVWIWNIYDAYNVAKKINATGRE